MTSSENCDELEAAWFDVAPVPSYLGRQVLAAPGPGNMQRDKPSDCCEPSAAASCKVWTFGQTGLENGFEINRILRPGANDKGSDDISRSFF